MAREKNQLSAQITIGLSLLLECSEVSGSMHIEKTSLKHNYISVFTKLSKHAELSPSPLLLGRHQGGRLRPRRRTSGHGGANHQRISAQVRELEKALGHQLLKPSGRGVALTKAGQAAFARAEEIFQLVQGIPDEVREAGSGKVARLAVGLSESIS